MTEEGDSHETEGDTADGDSCDCDAGESGKPRGTETTDSIATTRRKALESAGLAGAGVLLGYGVATVTDDDTACEQPLPRTVREYSDGGTGFWLGDNEKLQSRPIYSLSLPGTHHASFYEMTESWLSADLVSSGHIERWTKAQSRDVRTQLEDGVRYLDVRPFYDPEAEEGQPFWGHHEVARGAALKDVFDDISDFLANADSTAEGNEIVVVKLSHMEGFDTEDAREEFGDFLRSHLGDYALELPEMDTPSLFRRSLSSFDGSRVAVLYEGDNPWRGVADNRERWMRDGWVDEPRVVDAHTAAVELTHTGTGPSRLGETGYYVTPTERGIALAVGTGWLPFSGAWLGYESLRDAAERMSERFPCYINHAAADEGLNPNVLTVDHYQTTDVVDACRYLSSRGLRL